MVEDHWPGVLIALIVVGALVWSIGTSAYSPTRYVCIEKEPTGKFRCLKANERKCNIDGWWSWDCTDWYVKTFDYKEKTSVDSKEER